MLETAENGYRVRKKELESRARASLEPSRAGYVTMYHRAWYGPVLVERAELRPMERRRDAIEKMVARRLTAAPQADSNER